MKQRVEKLKNILEYKGCNVIRAEQALPGKEVLYTEFKANEITHIPQWLHIGDYINGTFSAFVHESRIKDFDNSCPVCGDLMRFASNECYSGHITEKNQ